MARGRKSRKPPAPENMNTLVPRKLSAAEVEERRDRFQRKYAVVRGLERRKAQVTREINGELKTERAELDKLHEEIERGLEQLAQGDLFADEEGEPVVPQPVAEGALSKIGELAAPPGNGHADAPAKGKARAVKTTRPKGWRGKRADSRA